MFTRPVRRGISGPISIASLAFAFQLDEQDGVFDYGRFECDSGLAFRSVVVFGTIKLVTEPAVKQAFCEALLRKYGKPGRDRPANFFPRLDLIAVFEIAIERLTGEGDGDAADVRAVAGQGPDQDAGCETAGLTGTVALAASRRSRYKDRSTALQCPMPGITLPL